MAEDRASERAFYRLSLLLNQSCLLVRVHLYKNFELYQKQQIANDSSPKAYKTQNVSQPRHSAVTGEDAGHGQSGRSQFAHYDSKIRMVVGWQLTISENKKLPRASLSDATLISFVLLFLIKSKAGVGPLSHWWVGLPPERLAIAEQQLNDPPLARCESLLLQSLNQLRFCARRPGGAFAYLHAYLAHAA